ncbi:MAG: CocE/NonD family hydrolase [Myxococcota bacterium]|nr:CocE/NonD family hydrolase [Myxococcota bacterium]
MKEQHRFPPLAALPLLGGIAWLWTSAQAGFLPFILTLPIGGGLFASGMAILLWAGDRRFCQSMALSGVLGLLALPFLVPTLGLGTALWLSGLAAAAAVAAGSISVDQTPEIEGVPQPEPSLRLSAGVALDEMVLGMEQLAIGLPAGDRAHRMVDEVHAAIAYHRSQGWSSDPLSYHATPPPLTAPRIETARTGKIAYEHLRFESLYEPPAEEPGRERWLALKPPRTAHAYVLRHADPDRPWIVCTNGYRMGLAGIDLRAFGHYHRVLGLNVLVPVLPLHGPRRIGRRSGDGFLGGDALDTLHGEAQAIWDIRRMIGWLRQQGASMVGAAGLSLGGYTTALLASVEPGLACVVAGIPVADLARIFWRHGPPLQLEYLAHLGVDEALVAELMTVISPLTLAPKVPLEARLIFGGTADRLVSPDHIRDLANHWDQPKTLWYSGGHLGFRMDPRIQHGVDQLLRDVKLCP